MNPLFAILFVLLILPFSVYLCWINARHRSDLRKRVEDSLKRFHETGRYNRNNNVYTGVFYNV
jgi:hypothetical protein